MARGSVFARPFGTRPKSCMMSKARPCSKLLRRPIDEILFCPSGVPCRDGRGVVRGLVQLPKVLRPRRNARADRRQRGAGDLYYTGREGRGQNGGQGVGRVWRRGGRATDV